MNETRKLNNKEFISFIALCGVIFMDGVGLGIIFPLMAPLFFDPQHSIVNINTSDFMRNLFYGISLCAFPLGIFFSAPALGDLSDGFGRKRILLISVIGVGLAYLTSAIAVSFRFLSLFIISRLISGLLSGSQPIAQAAAMDMSSPQNKTQFLSIVFFCSSIGFMVGPLFGGWLSHSSIHPFFNMSTPLYFAALLSFVCAYFLTHFTETNLKPRVVQFRLLRGFGVLHEVTQRPNLKLLIIAYFFYELAWSGFFQIIPAYLHKCFNLNSAMIGYYCSLMAVGFSLAFLGGVNLFSRYFKNHSLNLGSLIILTLCLILMIVIPNLTLTWLIALPSGFFVALFYVLITTEGASRAGEQYQGWFMGAAMSINAVAWFLSPIINSLLISLSTETPILFSALLYGISIGFYFYLIQKER